ncbi:hypothetical protein [Stenotrophomonas lacuserhaii]|uniref:hypothetical protein n=1 Tax=Stenotrophomonas lacuserhaii TaxID=2760084 RepID=UPI0015FA4152|nr:hypothetical protein [Stenotrophomonas lacuserhaii]
MDFLDRLISIAAGVNECWMLSPRCVVHWEAWAAIGGWLAAGATFLAVLLPYRRERKRSRLRSRLTLGAYAARLDRLARKMANISSARASLAAGDYRMPKHEVELFFGVEFDFPVLEIEPEMEGVIIATNGLRAELENWRRATQAFAFGPEDPVPPRQVSNLNPLLDALTLRIDVQRSAVLEAIGLVVPSLKKAPFRDV